MDYTQLLRSLSKRAVYSYRYYARWAAFVSAALLVGLPLGAQAAVLKINPGDNAGNVINLSGELSASVTHTAEGMVIDIPGVEIALVCDTNTDPDACTVTIGSTSSSTPASDTPPPASAPASDTSPPASDTPPPASDDAQCDPATDFLCKEGQTGSSGSDSDSDNSSDSGDNASGYTKPTTTPSTSSSDEDDPCSGTGYRKNCVNGVSTSSLADFPTGSARNVDNAAGTYNYGSAGQTRSSTITLRSGQVKVVGLSMDDTDAGRISFGPVGNIGGVALRAWISTAVDGAAVSSGCSYVDYVEGTLRISTDGSRDCNLSKGGGYYFNMALCASSSSDIYCSQAGAKATAADAKIILTSNFES